MRPNQTLDEARKYLLYVVDALHATASGYSTDKNDSAVLIKYAEDLYEYAKGLEQLKHNIIAKEQEKQNFQVTAELESAYEFKKKVSQRTQKNLHTMKAILKDAEKSGVAEDIDDAKRRLEYYATQHTIAVQNELTAKKDLELGA